MLLIRLIHCSMLWFQFLARSVTLYIQVGGLYIFGADTPLKHHFDQPSHKVNLIGTLMQMFNLKISSHLGPKWETSVKSLKHPIWSEQLLTQIETISNSVN